MPRPAEMELPLRALKLIGEVAGSSPHGVGARALAQALEVPPATLRRALDALLAQDFIRREGEGYVPGPACALAWAAFRAIHRRRLAESRAALEETETGEGDHGGLMPAEDILNLVLNPPDPLASLAAASANGPGKIQQNQGSET